MSPRGGRMAAFVGSPVHRTRLMVGLGWHRRRVTVDHAPVWGVVSEALDGRKIVVCTATMACTRMMIVPAGWAP